MLIVGDKWFQIETIKIIREKFCWCNHTEGINLLQKCRHLVDQYLEATRGVGWGYSFGNIFKNTFQSGFLSILYSLGNKPLQIWDKEVNSVQFVTTGTFYL